MNLRRTLAAVVTLWPVVIFAAAPAIRPLLIDAEQRTAAEFAADVRKALAAPVRTVVDKPKPSPTGDAHDYVSYARYYWPDPTKPDGLPFIQHDGRHNEEQVAAGDRGRIGKFADTVSVLTLAWRKDHREDCARRAGEWVRAWLLDPQTRMKPSLDFAQVRLGRDGNRGSPSGVLDGRVLAYVADSLRLLKDSPALSETEHGAARAWFEEYYRWLETAPTARKEHAAANNHGSWFLVQAAGIAAYLGRDEDVRRFCGQARALIDTQIKADGSQPEELRRQDALGYSRFNLEALLLVARIGRTVGVDLWRYESEKGGSLRKVVENLRPFNSSPEKWPGNQHEKLPPGFLDAALAIARELEG